MAADDGQRDDLSVTGCKIGNDFINNSGMIRMKNLMAKMK